jgi:hypothetical protein
MEKKVIKIFTSIIITTTIVFADISITTSKDNDIQTTTQKQITKVYLKKSDNINGKKVTPIDVEEDYNEFNKKVLNKNKKQIHSYWMKQIFTGTKIPPRKIKREQLNQELQNNKKAIGYSSQKIDGKVIYETK